MVAAAVSVPTTTSGVNVVVLEDVVAVVGVVRLELVTGRVAAGVWSLVVEV